MNEDRGPRDKVNKCNSDSAAGDQSWRTTCGCFRFIWIELIVVDSSSTLHQQSSLITTTTIMPSKPHPLRRISTNSLTALARSQQSSSESPSHLQFLAPALQDLVDESASLVQNTRALNKVSEALGVFNEGFGAYLYALRMGAFCVDWREGPEGGNFGESGRSAERSEKKVIAE